MARAEIEATQPTGHASKQRDADRRCTRHEELCSRETRRNQDNGGSEQHPVSVPCYEATAKGIN